MGIIGALYERGRCTSQQEIPCGRRPWNPTLHKTNGGAPSGSSLECRTLERRTLERRNNGNYATAVVTLRTANDSITRVTPLMIMLTPTRMPIAQAELDGHCM